MKPWSEVSPAELAAVRGVFTDIDDTLTTEGAITADALQALHDLHAAGIPTIPITGRPIGWAEPFARAWPVPAIVAENGAVAWVKTASPTRVSSEIPPLSNHFGHFLLSKIYQQDDATRSANCQRLQTCLADIEANIPGANRATDSAGRETDIAVDHSEFTHLSEPQIQAVAQRMRDHGLNATVSSIHINGWIGKHNKLSGARWILRQLFGRDLDAELHQWLYIGDSTNDQVMFEALPLTIGVANIARFVPQLVHRPNYVTQRERGAGFAQAASSLMLDRQV